MSDEYLADVEARCNDRLKALLQRISSMGSSLIRIGEELKELGKEELSLDRIDVEYLMTRVDFYLTRLQKLARMEEVCKLYGELMYYLGQFDSYQDAHRLSQEKVLV